MYRTLNNRHFLINDTSSFLLFQNNISDHRNEKQSHKQKKQNEIAELKAAVEEYQEKNSANDLLETRKIVKEYLKTRKNPPRELILKIVDKIEIHQDKTVDLYFKLKQLKSVV